MSYTIQMRNRQLVNTDPQRRCYNGCHYSSKLVWQPWVDLETTTLVKVIRRIQFWKELNDYAVSQRGKSALTQFRIRSN